MTIFPRLITEFREIFLRPETDRRISWYFPLSPIDWWNSRFSPRSIDGFRIILRNFYSIDWRISKLFPVTYRRISKFFTVTVWWMSEFFQQAIEEFCIFLRSIDEFWYFSSSDWWNLQFFLVTYWQNSRFFSTRLINEFHEIFRATVSRILQFPAIDWRISRFFGLSMDEFGDFCFRTTDWRISQIFRKQLAKLSILFHTTNLTNFAIYPRDLIT